MKSSIFSLFTVHCLILFVSIGNGIAMPSAWDEFKNDTEIPNIISRKEWRARPPVQRVPMEVTPTPYVVVHHGGIARYCYTQETCAAVVRSYQNYHIDDRGWFDIGYSFVIGEDGNVYEGRGWEFVGAHAPGYNTQSIGICIIGDFSDFLPNEEALKALNGLINYGVGIGKISDNYHVIGHRQVRNTLCPGEEFYKYVQEHPRWTPRPVPIYSNSTTTATDTVTTTNKNIVSTCT